MRNVYNSPLISGNCSKEMSYLFSDDMKYITWRKLWTVLAESEMELGCPFTNEQISQLKENINNINYETLEENEKEIKSELINNIYAFGLQCPEGKNIIHMKGDASYIKDNTDLIIIKEALSIIRIKLIKIINSLYDVAMEYKGIPMLSYCDFNSLSLMTVGKKISIWIKDLLIDYKNSEYILSTIEFKGIKGTSGNQLDLLELFDNDNDKVNTLDKMITAKMGFDRSFKLCGKYYSKKIITTVLSFLSQIGETVCKFANEYRFLENLRVLNDNDSMNKKFTIADRMSSLSKAVISNSLNGALISSSQYFDGSNDEFINQKISIAESFMEIDETLNLYLSICSNIKINENLISKHIDEQIFFIAADRIIQASVKKGAEKTIITEKVKALMKDINKKRDCGIKEISFIEKIAGDFEFKLKKEEVEGIIEPCNFTGRCENQVIEFVKEEVLPVIEANKHILVN